MTSADIMPSGPVLAEDLLGGGQGFLALAELHHRPAVVADHLVDHVAGRGVSRDAHAGADAEHVDGRACGDETVDCVFVQAAAGDDANVAETGVVKDRAHLAAEGVEIAGIEADAGEAMAVALHLLGDRDGGVGGVDGVVGVKQEDAAVGEHAGVGAEGVDLSVEAGDVGVGMVPVGGMP